MLRCLLTGGVYGWDMVSVSSIPLAIFMSLLILELISVAAQSSWVQVLVDVEYHPSAHSAMRFTG